MSDERLMTYAELAEALGIQSASAKKRAQRRKWRRVVGNDGLVRVGVPLEALSVAVPGGVTEDVMGDRGDVESLLVPDDLRTRLAHLEGLVEGLRGEVEAERRRADAAESRTRDVESDRDAWRHQAQRSLWQRLFERGH